MTLRDEELQNVDLQDKALAERIAPARGWRGRANEHATSNYPLLLLPICFFVVFVIVIS